MPITVEIPGPLRIHSNGSALVTLGGHCDSVREVLTELESQCPGVVDRVLTEQGDVREHVNLFVDGENTRYTMGLETPVKDSDTVTILAAISGG